MDPAEPTPPVPQPDDVAGIPPLPLTGARTSPGIPDETYWFQRHVAAYHHVAARIEGTVVDAGCGEGYGLRILRDAGARGVIGVDEDEPTVLHARRHHGDDTIEVVEADLLDLPLVVDTMDAVVSLQVIEHMHDVPGFLAELVRISRPGATIAISTPNRLTFSPTSTTPTNPFHVREFTADELTAAMDEAGIEVTAVEGVRHGARLSAALAEHGTGDLLATLGDPTTWTPALRAVVHAITADDFDVTSDDVATSLDLLAWGRV